MRMVVAAQEVLQAQELRGIRLAHEHGTAGAGFEQPDPAQDQRADDALAEGGLGDDQRAQLRRRHEERLDILFGDGVRQRVATGQERHLAGKLPRLEAHDGNRKAMAVALTDRHDALQHDEHARAPVRPR